MTNILSRVWRALSAAPALTGQNLREFAPSLYTDDSGAASGYATIKVPDLRARAEPNLTAAVLGMWTQGQRVIVWLERTADNWCWLENATGGLAGWSYHGLDYWEQAT